MHRPAALAQVQPARVDGDRLQAATLGTIPALMMTTHETVAIGGTGAQPLALIHVGGETLDDARMAVARLRQML